MTYIKRDGTQIVPEEEMLFNSDLYISVTNEELADYFCGKKIIQDNELIDNPNYKEINYGDIH